jgi:hypothetical protein
LSTLTLDRTEIADVVTAADGRRIVIEAKRPGRWEACSRRIEEAQKQLLRIYKGEDGSSFRGIIALDLTKIVGIDFYAPTAAEMEDWGKLLDEVEHEFKARYTRLLAKYANTQTIGVLLRVRRLLRDAGAHERLVAANQFFLQAIPGISARDFQTLHMIGMALQKTIAPGHDPKLVVGVEEVYRRS